ncbi:MAG: hypothetical protein IKT45_07005 [Lachnospiraceae bacterium]|nr:hypothetical protein [Lachnospiraceae bacterium]
MSRGKIMRKRGRRQKALMAFAWLFFLFALNLIVGLIPVFPFQANREMEEMLEIDETTVIWQAVEPSLDGYTYHLAINADVALFYKQRFFWTRGWTNGSVRLLSRNFQEPVVSKYRSVHYKDDHEVEFMGCVNSDQVASIDYYLEWEDGTVKVIEIREESYIYHGDERYYLQVEDGEIMYHPTQGMDMYPQKRVLRARDTAGNIIYEIQ